MHPDCLRAYGVPLDPKAVLERMMRVRNEMSALEVIARAQHPYSPRYYEFRQLSSLTRGRISDSAWLDVFNNYLMPDMMVGPDDLVLVSSQGPFFLLWGVLSRYEKIMADVLLVLGWKDSRPQKCIACDGRIWYIASGPQVSGYVRDDATDVWKRPSSARIVMDEAYGFSATLSECSKRVGLRDSPVVSADICVNSMLQLAPATLAHILLGALGRMGMVKRSGEITENIRNASIHSFETLAWMDANTSKANVERMNSIVSVDGVPAHLLDPAAVDRDYDFLPSFAPDDGAFGRQLLEARKRRFEKLRRMMYTDPEKVKRRSEIPLPILAVNAFYTPVFHVIVVTGAIMQASLAARRFERFRNESRGGFVANKSPFAVDTGDVAINYGSLGRIIGHELSHAFQMSTSSLDDHVQPLTLYSPASRKEFLARLNCLAKQVNDGSGSQTLGNNSIAEAFADNAGLEKAYLAFKALTQSDPTIFSKPANPLGYTAQQLFFVSSCFVFCAFQGYAFERNTVYPPPFLRCNTPAMNSPDFGNAFTCAQGAPMNPLVRCNFH
ncbi:hypothetical protein MTO96_018135 [Rhipicephalus appendiculatus]